MTGPARPAEGASDSEAGITPVRLDRLRPPVDAPSPPPADPRPGVPPPPPSFLRPRAPAPATGEAPPDPRLELVPAARTPGSAATEAEETIEGAIRLRVSLGIGIVMWLCFLAADAAMSTWYEPGPLWPYVVLRGLGAAVLVPIWWLLGTGRVRERRILRALDVTAYTWAALMIGLLCSLAGGLESPYSAGVPLVLACHTLSMADPWRRNIVVFGLPAIAHAVALLGSAAVSTRVAHQLGDARALVTFAVFEAVTISTCIFLLAGGQVMHDLRAEVRAMRRIGRYRLIRKLGGGGMGEVWSAWHEMLKREVAVKLMKPAIEQDVTAIARFEREVRATSELSHPHTVRIFDYGTTDDGRWYYVMELIEGETLLRIVERTGLVEPVRAAHLVAQAARALAEAHEREIVHRDVKPENILVATIGGEPDFVKVLDFGIAKILAGKAKDATLTAQGVLVGTPVYMAPEALQGGPPHPRWDIYALGAVLYFLLCARRPFEGGTYSEVLFAHMHGTPLTPSAKRGSPVPPELERIVMKGIAKRPEERWQSAKDMAAALEAYVAKARSAA